MRTLPTLKLEKELWADGYTVIGIDEVGRGAFAGPVYVSAYAIPPIQHNEEIARIESLGINDSKKLTSTKRTALSQLLKQENLYHATSAVDTNVINDKGIMFALNTAILQVTQELISKLSQKRIFVLLDGNNNPYNNISIKYSYRNIIKGDSLSLSIAAASIIAKVARDEYMSTLSLEFPQYNWSKNKGYGTSDHINAIKKFGHCDHHRLLYLRKLQSTLNV